ncbi:hypothetical protein ACQ86F_21715 [Streptomyces venezuelae ATCC 10712]
MQQIVLAVHGSVDPGSAPVLARLAARVRALASVPVTVAHLDHRSPPSRTPSASGPARSSSRSSSATATTAPSTSRPSPAASAARSRAV